MENKFESKNFEKETKYKSEIIIELFRHGPKQNDPNKKNAEQLLTFEGRELVRKKAKKFNPEINMSVAGASPMDRTAESAILAMTVNKDEIKVNDSLEVMDEKFAKELKIGKKIYRDERLTFILDGETGAQGMKAFKAGEYMDWLIKDSDRQILENKDLKTTSYLRQAANITELIQRYSKIGDNFNRLVEKKDDYKKYNNRLERYLGTHQSVAESFIAKVLELQEGLTDRDNFIKNIKNGWPEMEGVKFKIVNVGKEQTIVAHYNDNGEEKELKIKPDTLKRIIEERRELEQIIKE